MPGGAWRSPVDPNDSDATCELDSMHADNVCCAMQLGNLNCVMMKGNFADASMQARNIPRMFCELRRSFENLREASFQVLHRKMCAFPRRPRFLRNPKDLAPTRAALAIPRRMKFAEKESFSGAHVTMLECLHDRTRAKRFGCSWKSLSKTPPACSTQ